MQIKRRINAISKRVTPFIESMNISVEMDNMCKRFEELLDYGEAKELRHKEREKTGQSLAMRIDQQRREEREHIAEINEREAEEQLKDQQQRKAQPDVEVADAGGEPAQAEEG